MVDNEEKDIDQQLLIKKDHNKKSNVLGAVFGEGKLKVLKDEEVESMEEDQKFGFIRKYRMNNDGNNNKRECHFCHKIFSSGKALGGHMRIHVQKKGMVFKKKLKANHSINFKKQNPCEEKEGMIDFMGNKNFKKKMPTDSDNSGKKPSCIICCKDFPSMKSLFGHMRCHPEREWRGIRPPSMEKNSFSSSSSLSEAEYRKFDDQMDFFAANEGRNRSIDLTESLKGWPVTDRRGRKALSAASSLELSSSEEHQLLDAGDCLVMLAQGDSNECGLKHMKKVVKSEFEPINSINSISKATIVDAKPVYESNNGKIDQSFVEFRPHFPINQLDNEDIRSSELEKTIVDKGLVLGESVRKLDSEDQFAKDDGKIYCSDGNQSDSKDKELQLKDTDFNNTNVHEGMIKNKKKRKQIKLCDLEFEQNITPIHPKVPIPQPTKYRCSTCDKSFPTHQALGGHKASHKAHSKFRTAILNPISYAETAKEIKKGTSSKMVETSSLHQCVVSLRGHKEFHGNCLTETPSSQVTCRNRMLDFDLNEKPPLDDHEADIKSDLAVGK